MSLAQLINKGPSLAELLRRQGRGKDSILAHINPREAAILRRHGGSGRMNPRTGLPEFDDSTDIFDQSDNIQAQPLPPPDQSAQATPDTSAAPSPDVSTADTSAAPDPSFFLPDFSTGPSGGGAASSAPSTASNDFVTTSPYATDVGTGPAPLDVSGLGGNTGVGDTGGDSTTQTGTKQPQSYGDKLLSTLTNPSNLAKVVGGVGLGALGLINSNKAASQAQSQANQISALGTPFTQQGNNILQSTLGGALTPGSSQQYQAAQAKLAQDAVNRGGVGAQQNVAIAEGVRQQLLQSQFTAGLNLIQIGNSYVESGIKESIVANQQVNAATQAFYTSLFKGLSSIQ